MMNIKSKDEIRDIIRKDLLDIHNRGVELRKHLDENFDDSLAYLRALASQLSKPSSGPLVAKTPKITRKRAVQRIETIPEDEVLHQDNISSAESLQSINEKKHKISEYGARVKRSASKRAADKIKKQCSISLAGKLQPDDNVCTKKIKRESQVKRKKSVSSSDEEDSKSSSKYSKVDDNLRKKSEQVDQQPIVALTKIKQIEKIEEKNISESSRSVRSDDIDEVSMYEDAIGKPIPIMSSTIKSSSFLPGKLMDAIVVLERLSQPKLNETVVIQKSQNAKTRQSEERTSRDNLQSNEQNIQYNNYNELMTDDESSPELKERKKQITKEKKYITSNEDEIPNTPMKTLFKNMITSTVAHETKHGYKSSALFSPYAKETVKKRVEAFEQAVMYSPKSVDVDIPTRVTRTKTRAMIAAETEAKMRNTEKNVAQMLARKSLAKAKRISLAKQKKGNEEFKENTEQMSEQIVKSLLNDKPNLKQTQLQKVTPLSKTKIIQPLMSGNRIHTPSHAQNLLNYPKTLTASRTNIVSNIDSFIQPPKSISKANSIEKLEKLGDKRRHEEDARKKREETLRLLTEEKKRKRQEKELKNKLAREAKEKQELEKRQKAEKEREERAKLALLMQEKQREELEKKRLAQLQRAQEKEERRKLEEQQRLQKLQEQEETERLLAEQKRREQEAEKRKEAEAGAQAAEALKQKYQMIAAQVKYNQDKQANNKNQGVTHYMLDSDPDDDESDDESRPKHEIPYWAQPQIRKTQLAIQRHIPQEIVYKFFDTRKCTPNLAEMFTGIDRKKLARTSSAIWKTPPRFSMMETE
ncbi:inner centromere protein [Camponotus floridanus]|uniref:inner centromere protein n=1 Tax=Camponotus floridanus TaxID=104421 RepID=UPI000DC6C43D|nr:inner centromere protein [Camponotus floridanus]